MIDNPDSAELILNSIPRNQLNSRALKARFALLYSQALDKCYIDTDNDSLIRVAVDYYSRRGSDHEKAKAYYYESVVYRNAKDIDSQVKSLVKAHEFAHKTTDAYLEGLIHNKLGQLYHSQKQFDKALISHQRAVEEFEKADRPRNQMYALNALGNTLQLMGKTDEAIAARTKARDLAKALNDTVFVIGCDINILNTSQDWTKENINSVKNSILNNAHLFSKGELYRHLSNLYEKEGDADSTKYYLTKYIENDKFRTDAYCGGVAQLSFLLESEGNFKDALKYVRMYSKAKNSIHEVEKKNIIEDLERKYKTQQLREAYEAFRQRQLLLNVIGVLTTIILVFIIIYIVYVYKRRMANQQQNYESYIVQYDTKHRQLQSQYDALAKNVGAYRTENGEFGIKLIEALQSRLTSLKTLSEFAYLHGENAPKRFYKKFQEHILISKNRNDEFTAEILEVANILNNGLITYLEQNFPDITKHELSYCGLVALGFTPDSIRVLYNHTHLQSLYTIRFRIKSKLGLDHHSHSSCNLEDFVLDLCNKLKNNEIVVNWISE